MQAEWPKHVILRASIIIGPQSPVPVSRPLFLQFIVQQLAEQKETTFFTDEFRNPTYVVDIVEILSKLIAGEETLHNRYTADVWCQCHTDSPTKVLFLQPHHVRHCLSRSTQKIRHVMPTLRSCG